MPYLQTNDIQTSASRLGFGKESGRIWGSQGGCAKHGSLAGLWISVSDCSIHPTSQWTWMCWGNGYKRIQLEIETIPFSYPFIKVNMKQWSRPLFYGQ